MTDESRPYALGPGEGRFIDLGDFGMTVKASDMETGDVVSVLEAEEPPGFGPPIHVHHDCAEAFYVLEGEYIMSLEDRELVCPAGSFIFIPQGARHGFRVGNVPSRKLNFYFPASMIGYFDDLSAALQGTTWATTRWARSQRDTQWRSSARRRSGTSSDQSRLLLQILERVSSLESEAKTTGRPRSDRVRLPPRCRSGARTQD